MTKLNLRRALPWLLCCATLAAASGCAMRGYDASSAQSVDLGGRWVLDPAASDDAPKLIADATPAPPPALSAGRADPYTFGSGPSAPEQGGGGRRHGAAPGAAGGQDRLSIDETGPRLRPSERAQFVRSLAVPAEQIQIDQGPARFILVQGDRRREFEPGQTTPQSITDHYGSREIRAGWNGREFVIAGEDRNHVSVQEHLRAGPGTDTLELEVTLKAWNYKKIRVRSLYRRADGSLPLPAAVEGPPARGSH